MLPSSEYNFSNINKFDTTFGSHVRLEGNKVQLDTTIGKYLRKALVSLGVLDKKEANYVENIKSKVELLNKAGIETATTQKISKLLAKDIVKDNVFHTALNDHKLSLQPDAVVMVKLAQRKLLDQLKEDPKIKFLAEETMNEILKDKKHYSFDQHLLELEKRGVDLSEGKIDAAKLVDYIIKLKEAQNPDLDVITLRTKMTNRLEVPYARPELMGSKFNKNFPAVYRELMEMNV